MEKGGDLLVLDTRDILGTAVAETLRKAEALGEENYQTFVQERLIASTKPITDVIPKNKLALFSNPPAKSPSKQKMQVAALKMIATFSHDCMFLAKQELEI